MQIEFTRSGGFVPIPLTVTLDTASMPAAAAKELEAKVDAADFFNLPSTIGDPRLPDVQKYTVAVTTPQRQHQVVIAGDVPPAAQSLIEHLVKAAKAARSAAARSHQ